jgi:pyruvate ferredoxin oxidoreductase alpha subunit
MSIDTTRTETERKTPEQIVDFKNGNEMVDVACRQINFHVMGYYPITPSTDIPEGLDEMKAEGEHNIVMIPAEGEHSAAGICYGASTGGGRVLNATASQGLLYALEQLPVQAGTRFPMVLNVVTRTVSGPLNILGDHSDLMYALNTGWIILMARDVQACYDMNIIAVKIGEHPEVRLPVIVASDGFFTSHQKRRVHYFADDQVVQNFIGKPNTPNNSLDPSNPVTIGPYMNDPDLINNHYQLKMAMDAAERVLPQIFQEYGDLSGRYYPIVGAYQTDDADAAVFLLNSAAETAKDAADLSRQRGQKVGVISPNVIRPFPAKDIQAALKNVPVVLIGDRADSYGAKGGNMSLEVRAALKQDPDNRSLTMSRVYGLGGKDFSIEDAQEFFNLALEAARNKRVDVEFDYYGVNPGDPSVTMERPQPVITKEEASPSLTSVTIDEASGKLKVKVATPRELTKMPQRIAPGHGACPGCGIPTTLDQFLKGIEGNVVLLFQTGCGMVVTTPYPYTSHRVTYVHNLFQNGAATLSGLVEMYHERMRRGEIPEEEITFIMVSGDGGMDIGFGSAIGAAIRGHAMILLEYDNEGYMNTGNQLSYATPLGNASSTSHVGPFESGKSFQHKDTAQIMAATNIPYVFTSVEGLGTDLVKKAAKAQWYARHGGFSYGKVLSVCTLSWRFDESQGTGLLEDAVNSCFFPVYEVENGKTTINYDPETKGKGIPVGQFFGRMGKSRHLTKPDYKLVLEQLEAEVQRRWLRLKAKHDSPIL